jgi:hypothetical protein
VINQNCFPKGKGSCICLCEYPVSTRAQDIGDAGDSAELPEMHAMSAGLKAMTTFEVLTGALQATGYVNGAARYSGVLTRYSRGTHGHTRGGCSAVLTPAGGRGDGRAAV